MSKSIVLTGGTSGIGLATLKSLNEQGHSVILVVRDQEKAKRVLVVASGGGHWQQLMLMRDAWAGLDATYATESH